MYLLSANLPPLRCSHLELNTYIRGYYTVLELAKHHARVYLGTRSDAKGAAAIASIKEAVPHADVQVLMMDLMNLGNVVAVAKELAVSVPAVPAIQLIYPKS